MFAGGCGGYGSARQVVNTVSAIETPKTTERVLARSMQKPRIEMLCACVEKQVLLFPTVFTDAGAEKEHCCEHKQIAPSVTIGHQDINAVSKI
jgi:hypothetical protein